MGFSRFDENDADRREREERALFTAEERSERLAKQLRDDGLAMAKAAASASPFPRVEDLPPLPRELLPEPVGPYVVECALCDRLYTVEAFRELPLRGYMGGAARRLELRRCGCENVISIRVRM